MKTLIFISLLFLYCLGNLIYSQPIMQTRSIRPYYLSSGKYDGSDLNNPKEVLRKTISLPGVSWTRLKFNSANLGKNSYMEIKSLEDNSTQTLNSVTIEQWNFSSAYFNGDSLIISLFVCPGDRNVFFNITELFAGEVVTYSPNMGGDGPNGIEDLCDSDDRILSNEKAVGRIITEPYGLFGTGFILFNGKIATAGHVISNISNSEYSIIEFNVPLSNSDGSPRYAAAIDQYTFKYNFIIDKHTNGEGDDWGIFYTNTNSGLGPKERQNSFFYIEQNNTFQTVRVTGFGQDDGTYNRVQQTSNGSNQNSAGNIVKYNVDTKADNSGSPVINLANGYAVGIHTHRHCADLGYNSGTSFFNSSLWATCNPEIDLTIHQKREAGNELTGTYIGRWMGELTSGNFQDYLVGSNGASIEDVVIGSYETFRAKQDRTTSGLIEKYNKWNNYDDIINHREFLIEFGLTELVSQFKQTYSGVTLNNEFPEVPGLNPSSDVIEFKDPWLIDLEDPVYNGTTYRNRGTSALFKSRAAPFYPNYDSYYGSDQYLGLFLNQDPALGLINYSVRSPIQQPQDIYLTQTGKYHKFYFYNWSSTGTDPLTQNNIVNGFYETPVVLRSGSATVTAKLKGTQISNTQNAYANPNQRRFVKSSAGYFHIVYESMGKIWYERSTNNGQTWQIMNGGKPLNDGLGKYPSIDYLPSYYGNDQVVIVYWEESLTSPAGSKIIAYYFDNSYPKILKGVVANDYLVVHENSQPVVSISQGGFILVAFNSGSIVYRLGRPIYTDNLIYWDTPLTEMNWGGDIIEFRNPTIGSSKSGSTNSYWVAWDDNNSSIKFKTMTVNYNPQTYDYYITEGIGGGFSQAGFSMNYQPSISVMPNNDFRLSWFGENYVDGIGQKQIVTYFNYQFYIFGTNVSSHSMRTTDDGKSIITYGDQSGTRNKFRQIWYYTLDKSLGTTGRQTHLSNGTSLSNMYAMSLQNATLPYSFTMSANLGSLQKVTEIPIASGRKGIVVGDSAEFYFTLGDVTLNGNTIDFIPTGINPDFSKLDTLNYYLSTQKFNVTNSSQFNFSIEYGVTDSLKAVQSLAENEYVKFKLQLINANTNQVLGEYTVVTFTKHNVIPYYGESFSINTNGIGNKKVRVRIVVEENIGGEYAMANISAEENVLPKQNQNVISYSGSEVVTVYALEQNYPNPFNPTTTIKYQIPTSGNVTIKVYDILGNEVANLVAGYMETGKYEVDFDASSLASGVYIYRLSVNDFVNVKKMVLLK